VDVKDKPLAEVIRSIEKQAGIVLKTNMDSAKPVSMHVYKVPLTEAMETLAGVTESRWRLGYFFGPDSATVKGALETIATGNRPEGWERFEVPLFGLPGSMGDEVVPMDPRRDTWAVKEPESKTLQGFLRAAAAGVSASFSCPKAFDPAVAKTPSSGRIHKSAPQLASAAGAKMEEVFLLMGRPSGSADAGSDRDRGDDLLPGGFGGGGPPRGSRGGSSSGGSRDGDRKMMRERVLAEIDKLPASEQAQAKADFEERDKMFASMRDLSDEERRAKMEEMMSRPDVQERMADRQIKGSERRTPEQRRSKYESYVAKKQEAKAK
jgi:hypothetical protein